MNKLLEMSKKFPQTKVWNDSCSVKELKYCMENGGVGATTNPVIVKSVLETELPDYEAYIKNLIEANPTASEDELAWDIIEKFAIDGAKILEPVFNPKTGEGKISIQTNTKNYKNTEKLVEQAVYFATLAPNMQVKMPATAAGIKAFEEATYRGVSINATVSFTATQAIAVGEAVQKGLDRRTAEGLDNTEISPVCTIMVGRMDDWLKAAAEKAKIAVYPPALDMAGVACVKKAYKVYKERGYQCKMLSAAYRTPLHWLEFIGGDVVLTIPYKYQVMFNNSDFEIVDRMNEEVDPYYIKELRKLPDFVKAYDHMEVEDFDTFGVVNKTLDQFAHGYDDLVNILRKFMFKY